MEKFEIDIKWGGYFLVINILTSISIAVLMCLIDFHSLRYLADLLVPIFIVQLLYFTSKAIRENKENGLSKGFRKIFVCFRLLIFYLFIATFLNGNVNGILCLSSVMPYRKKDISELSTEIDFIDDHGMSSNDLFSIFKRKFFRG